MNELYVALKSKRMLNKDRKPRNSVDLLGVFSTRNAAEAVGATEILEVYLDLAIENELESDD